MSLRKITLGGLLVCGACTIANADGFNPNVWFEPGMARYEEKEWTLDTVAIVASRDRETFINDNSLGIGVGVNYFITRYFGVGADTYIDSFDFPNHLDISGLARFPIKDTPWAPYALAGFGRQFNDLGQWSGHIGIGVEYRWNRLVGVIFDVREVFPDRTSDFSLWRLGLRFQF